MLGLSLCRITRSRGKLGRKIDLSSKAVAGEKLDIFGDVPYSHLDKKDKLGRHAESIISSYPSYNQKTTSYQKRRDNDFKINEFSFKNDAAEDSTYNTAGRYNNHRVDRKQDRVPSLAVGGDWDMIEEFDLAQLLKLAANIPKVQDLTVAGHLDQYDENFDKITTRTAKLLKRVENKFFCDVTTSEDPVLERLAVEQVGDVYATDVILAQLMAAPRSVYRYVVFCLISIVNFVFHFIAYFSFHLVNFVFLFSVNVIDGKVHGINFLDKRENSSFDLLTVSETVHEPPRAREEFEEINRPDNGRNCRQQVIMGNGDGVRKVVRTTLCFSVTVTVTVTVTCSHSLFPYR